MSEFRFVVDSQGLQIKIAEKKAGLFGRFRKREPVDLSTLVGSEKTLAIALSRIRALDRDGEHHKLSGDRLWLDHWIVSRLDDMSAAVLGVPGKISGVVFHAEMRGSLGSESFSLEWWWERDERQIRVNRTGAIVELGGTFMRLPAQIYDAILLSEAFDSGCPLPDHWRALSEFRASLGDLEEDGLTQPELYLRKVEIVSCDKVGLAVDPDDPLGFAPLPFVSHHIPQGEMASEGTAALQGRELSTFKHDASQRGAQPAYRVGENRFLILDRSVVPVVDVIARHAKGTEVERKDFLENADRIVADAIEQALIDDGRLNELMPSTDQVDTIETEIQNAWAETREWTDRVIEIRKWTKPEIEVLEGSGTSWLPDDVDAIVGEILGTIPDEELEFVLQKLQKAQKDGDQEIQLEQGIVPVTALVIQAVKRRLELYLNRSPQDPGEEAEVTAFLPVTHDNFWELEFRERLHERVFATDKGLPATLKTSLHPHQKSAFDWQVSAWEAGLPGILNADEQGLGKTVQTLSFLAWLNERMTNGELPIKPFLIVAPTSLLRNWEDEARKHLFPGVFGKPVRLYGRELKAWRVQGARGRDIQDGRSKLDLSDLIDCSEPRLVITTYQTLANYAVTFAQTPFEVAVFDEIQNLKNPSTLRSNAAKAVNAEFRIGLTGTPVENATRDIWAVMDQLFPGALGSLNDFRIAFDVPKRGNMQELHRAVFSSNKGYPALGIRRTKEEAASDLPPKVRVLHPRIMPEIQALRYDEARKPGQSLFGLLHHIRRTSLHPGLIEGEAPETFIHASARVLAAMDVLRAIKAKEEKVLVFVENRDVQAWFSELIKIEFGLHRVDVINGSTPVSRRKEITDYFQRHLQQDEGFDVLVMGPRAAGTGLTLTAANHVIHLTRWWNPAVEEQCNDRTHRIGQTRPVTVHIPLAIHPRLQRGSFDCLLQKLMKNKRSLADSVLWPPESDENEVRALYDAVVSATEGDDDKLEDEGLILSGRPDLEAQELGEGILRVCPKGGGASVVVALHGADLHPDTLRPADDAAAIILSDFETSHEDTFVPMSVLGGPALWPDFVLPD